MLSYLPVANVSLQCIESGRNRFEIFQERIARGTRGNKTVIIFIDAIWLAPVFGGIERQRRVQTICRYYIFSRSSIIRRKWCFSICTPASYVVGATLLNHRTSTTSLPEGYIECQFSSRRTASPKDFGVYFSVFFFLSRCIVCQDFLVFFFLVGDSVGERKDETTF